MKNNVHIAFTIVRNTDLGIFHCDHSQLAIYLYIHNYFINRVPIIVSFRPITLLDLASITVQSKNLTYLNCTVTVLTNSQSDCQIVNVTVQRGK